MASTPQSHWLTASRLRVYPRIFLAVFVLMAAGWVLMSTDMVDPKGKPLGADFITFWGASWLALSGHAADAYDIGRIFAAEQVAVPASTSVFLWHYPPMFHLVVLPLALMPYLVAYCAWCAATFAACIVAIKRLAPRPETVWLLLAFPGTFINLFHGQNGFLTAALFGGAALFLKERPFAAGFLLGLMVYKPQLGVLIPLALICGRQWTALSGATAGAVLFAGLSAAVIGVDAWDAFIRNLPLVRQLLEQGALPWSKIPSIFISLRMLHVPQTFAYGVHAVFAIAVALAVALVWWRQAPLRLAMAVMVSSGVLVPPYLFDYDLAVLAVPLAILAWDGLERGWQRYEREVLVAAWLTPMLAPILGENTNIPLASVTLIALFVVAVRRALSAAPAHAKIQAFAAAPR